MNRKLSFFVTVIVFIALLINPTNVKAFPSLPSSFYGKIKVNNVNVADGTLVEALINGQVVAKTNSLIYKGESYYKMNISNDDAATSALDGGKEGDALSFQVDGHTTSQTGIWHSGTNVELNLIISSTASNQPTSTPDPKKISSSNSETNVQSFPSLPSSLYGKVKVNNKNVPDGTLVEFLVNGQVISQTKTLTFKNDSYYTINIPGDNSGTSAQNGGKEGDTISIKVGGLTAKQTGIWHSGTNLLLDINVSSLTGLLSGQTATPANSSLAASVTPIIPVTNSGKANQNIILTVSILIAVVFLVIIVGFILFRNNRKKRNIE